MSSLQRLLAELSAATRAAGQTPYPVSPATQEDVEALSDETGCPIPSFLSEWFMAMTFELPLRGNYETQSIAQVLRRIQGSRGIDFAPHKTNILSWNDGRFEDGRLAQTYWSRGWVPIAFDGGGNEYCVDLAPGPNGAVGQMIAMEFQDGQGPYVAKWATLEAMLLDHAIAFGAKVHAHRRRSHRIRRLTGSAQVRFGPPERSSQRINLRAPTLG